MRSATFANEGVMCCPVFSREVFLRGEEVLRSSALLEPLHGCPAAADPSPHPAEHSLPESVGRDARRPSRSDDEIVPLADALRGCGRGSGELSEEKEESDGPRRLGGPLGLRGPLADAVSAKRESGSGLEDVARPGGPLETSLEPPEPHELPGPDADRSLELLLDEVDRARVRDRPRLDVEALLLPLAACPAGWTLLSVPCAGAFAFADETALPHRRWHRRRHRSKPVGSSRRLNVVSVGPGSMTGRRGDRAQLTPASRLPSLSGSQLLSRTSEDLEAALVALPLALVKTSVPLDPAG